MQPGDPVVGSSILRRPAIQSPNYVHGVSGWAINQDGSAEFNNVTINVMAPGSGLTVAGSTSTAQLTVDGAGNAELQLWFNATPSNVSMLALLGNGLNVNGPTFVSTTTGDTLTPQLFLAPHLAELGLDERGVRFEGGLLQLTETQAVLSCQVESTANAYVQITNNTIFLNLKNSIPAYLQCDIQNNFGRIAVGGEPWHDFVLQNGWTSGAVDGFDNPGYQMSAQGRPEFRGLGLAGTRANGTVVANLPAAYRPSKVRHVYTSADPGVSPFGCILEIETNGDIKIFGLGTGGVLGFDGVSFVI